MMSSAEASWRRRLAEHPAKLQGGEHTRGACRATVARTLRILRSAIEANSKWKRNTAKTRARKG